MVVIVLLVIDLAHIDTIPRQKHEAVLYEIAGGEEKLISASVAEVGEKVQEILGINANQFRQIVMLPQGEFSRLLKAREEERVELLKSIFRMDLYNTLKDKVASGLREIRGRHNDLSVEMETERQHIKCSGGSALADTLTQNDKTMDYVLDLIRGQYLQILPGHRDAEFHCLQSPQNFLQHSTDTNGCRSSENGRPVRWPLPF